VSTGGTLKSRLEEVRGRIAAAAGRSGRAPDRVRLVGVVKTVPDEAVREVLGLGLRDLGESRVQEAAGRVAALGRDAAVWHLIGHLQRNKAARALELFDWIHSVDSAALARALSGRVPAGRRLPVMLEVNVSGEATKFGVAPADLDGLLEEVAQLPGLDVRGLMTVGPAVPAPGLARPAFAKLRELRERAERSLGRSLPELSMGMSGDYEVAVEEGSTMVRVGTAIFGAR
jgi:pyridoxal phosphate enzyme (YggS family)